MLVSCITISDGIHKGDLSILIRLIGIFHIVLAVSMNIHFHFVMGMGMDNLNGAKRCNNEEVKLCHWVSQHPHQRFHRLSVSGDQVLPSSTLPQEVHY